MRKKLIDLLINIANFSFLDRPCKILYNKIMRIITGSLRGRKVPSPDHDGVRPTSDRVKESLFNIIWEKVAGGVFLDLFSGTGNIGFEAISRGAGKVYMVDNNRLSYNSIRATAEKFGVKPYIILSDYNMALKNCANQGVKFDCIFIDPPYESNLAEYAIKQIENLDLLKEGGILVWESSLPLKKLDNFESRYKMYDIRKYGEIGLAFFVNE